MLLGTLLYIFGCTYDFISVGDVPVSGVAATQKTHNEVPVSLPVNRGDPI